MTISAFCRSQLLEHGPLSLEVLTERAVAAGKTTSRSPAPSVRSAINDKELLLADGRWVTPLWLLEGRTLTTRRLSRDEAWERHDDRMTGCERERHDLALLLVAGRGGGVPLATGGFLKSDLYSSRWRAPRAWPHVRARDGELLALRVEAGVLHVDVISQTPDVTQRGEELAAGVGGLDGRRRGRWGSDLTVISDNLTDHLVERMVTDPLFLREPVPPLSECIPPLDVALRRERRSWLEDQRRWRPQISLPPELREIAIDEAQSSNDLLDEWLQDFVIRSLRALEGDERGQVLQLLPRAWLTT